METDQHCIRILIQSEISLELKFVLNLFFAEGLGIIILSNACICLRIKHVIINSIDDTTKIM